MAWPRASWQALLALGVLSRLLVMGLSLLAPLGDEKSWAEVGADPEMVKSVATQQAKLETPTRRPLRAWYRWDAWYYLDIAESGYHFTPGQPSNVAFLPLLPVTIKAGSAVGLDPYWVGYLVPNLAFALGIVAFGRVAAHLSGEDGFAWRACLLLMTFPTAFFFSAPYQESLGFALLFWAAWAWIDRRPIATSFFAGLATSARLTNLGFSVAVVAEWFNDLIHRRKPRQWAWPVAILSVWGLACVMLYMGYALGDPLAMLKSHSSWGRKPGLMGLAAFARQFFEVCRRFWLFDLAVVVIVGAIVGRRLAERFPSWRWWPRGGLAQIAAPALLGLLAGAAIVAFVGASQPLGFKAYLKEQLSELYIQQHNLAFLLFLCLGLSLWQRRGPFWGCLALIPIAMAAVTGSPMSMPRIVLSASPAFLEATNLCGKRWFFWAVVIVGALAEAIMMTRYSRMFFVF